MSKNYELFQGFEFIPVENNKRGGNKRQQLARNVITIRRRNEGKARTFLIRFSPALINELSPYDSARLAKNSVTGDIYIVFFKDGGGDVDLRIDRAKSNKTTKIAYPIINGQPVVNALLKHLHIEDGDVYVRAEVSENLSHLSSFYTMLITRIISKK